MADVIIAVADEPNKIKDSTDHESSRPPVPPRSDHPLRISQDNSYNFSRFLVNPMFRKATIMYNLKMNDFNKQVDLDPREYYELKYSYDQVEALTNECDRHQKSASRKAEIYRVINILFTLVIVIFGALVGTILGTQDNYTWAVLSYIISVAQLLNAVFDLSKTGVYFKYASLRFANLKRSLTEAVVTAEPGQQLLNVCHRISQEMQDIDLLQYKESSPNPNTHFAQGEVSTR